MVEYWTAKSEFPRSNYRPQRSCGKVIFSQASVSHSVHREGIYLSTCWDTHTPLGRHPPPYAHPHQKHTPRSTTSGKYTPWEAPPPHPGSTLPGKHTPPEAHPVESKPPPGSTPPGKHTPGKHTHPPEAKPPIRRSLQRTVRILLECFVLPLFGCWIFCYPSGKPILTMLSTLYIIKKLDLGNVLECNKNSRFMQIFLASIYSIHQITVYHNFTAVWRWIRLHSVCNLFLLITCSSNTALAKGKIDHFEVEKNTVNTETKYA